MGERCDSIRDDLVNDITIIVTRNTPQNSRYI